MADEITISSNGVNYKALVTTSPAAAGAAATQVVGNVASGTADSGNPVKIGGVIRAAARSALTDGQRGDALADAWGNLTTAAVAAQAAGSDGFANTRTAYYGASSQANYAVLMTSAPHNFNGTSWDRQRGDTNGTYAVAKGSGGIATSQVSVGVAATQIVAARAGRGAVTITNVTGAQQIFIGVAGVTATTGTLLPAAVGASLTIPTNAAIFGIALTAAQTVSVLEVF